MRLRLALATAAVLAAPATAQAATPEAGEVSKDKLVQRWSGTVTSSFVHLLVPDYRETRCDAPVCDEFTLELKDEGDLKLTVTSPDSAQFVDLRVTHPDGTVEVFPGNDADKSNTQTIPDAPLGTYKVAMYNNALIGLNTGEYTGRATLVLPPAE